jgi:hypothetical protein
MRVGFRWLSPGATFTLVDWVLEVYNCTYLDSLLNGRDLMQPEISERICKANRAATAKLLSSELLKRSIKMNIYVTFVRLLLHMLLRHGLSTNVIKMCSVYLKRRS